jgi:hypothetical protein
MGSATDLDSLSKACEAGSEEACELLRRKRMAGFKDGGLLADASRTWRMESDYPEFEKGVANRLSKERVPEAVVEEQFNYSPLQRGYAEGGEVGNFMDETGSMLAPEVPLNFEDEMGDEMMLEDDMMMEEESGLTTEQERVLAEAMSDYPELEDILDTLGSTMGTGEFIGEGSVEGPGTETSDSIPAQLSDGEFVFTAKSVKQLGVDKLRKMMAKAEEDYDEADAEQEFAQMGDEGFASGGLLTKPKYGSYEKGGRVKTSDLGFGKGKEYTKRQINFYRKQFGSGFMEKVVPIGNGLYKIKGLKHGGSVSKDYGLLDIAKESVDSHYNRNQTKETLGQTVTRKAKGLGQKAIDIMDKVLGPPVDRVIDAWNTPSSSIDTDTDYEGIARMKAEQEFIDRNRAEQLAQMKADSILDRKGKIN